MMSMEEDVLPEQASEERGGGKPPCLLAPEPLILRNLDFAALWYG